MDILYFTVDRLRDEYRKIKEEHKKLGEPSFQFWNRLKSEENKDKNWLFKVLITRFFDYQVVGGSKKADEVLIRLDDENLLNLEQIEENMYRIQKILEEMGFRRNKQAGAKGYS